MTPDLPAQIGLRSNHELKVNYNFLTLKVVTDKMFSKSIVKAWGINWTNFRQQMSIQLFICDSSLKWTKIILNFSLLLLESSYYYCSYSLWWLFVLLLYFIFCIASLLYFFVSFIGIFLYCSLDSSYLSLLFQLLRFLKLIIDY